MQIDIESLERATLDAVAPDSVGTLPGWLLPFDATTVGRAKSAVPLSHHQSDPTLIPLIESCYAERGLKAQFRVADVAGLSTLQQGLLEHGYIPQHATLTMMGDVRHWPKTKFDSYASLTLQPTDAWKSVYRSSDFDAVDGANRVRAFSRSRCLVYACLEDESGALAAGTASFSQGWASLHGLRTIARARGKGYASALINALGNEALARNLNQCFLQVDEENAPARSLYQRLGFLSAWRYHYWCKPA